MVPYLLIDYQLWYLTSWMTASSASGQVLYDPVLGYLFNLSPYRRLLHFGCVLLELNRPEASQPIDHILRLVYKLELPRVGSPIALACSEPC